MDIGFYICLVLGAIFGIMTLVFAMLGKKAAILIGGFNSLPKTDREMYDTKQMSKDQMYSLLLWTIIMIMGALLSYLSSEYMAIAALLLWILVFIKDVHMDTEKAFEKYKLK